MPFERSLTSTRRRGGLAVNHGNQASPYIPLLPLSLSSAKTQKKAWAHLSSGERIGLSSANYRHEDWWFEPGLCRRVVFLRAGQTKQNPGESQHKFEQVGILRDRSRVAEGARDQAKEVEGQLSSTLALSGPGFVPVDLSPPRWNLWT